MGDINDADLQRALKKRRSYIKANLECVAKLLHLVYCIERYSVHESTMCRTLTMKTCRKMLEEDMGLPATSLATHKDVIRQFVDKV